MRTLPLLETNPTTEGLSSWVFLCSTGKKIRTSNRPDLSLKAKEYLARLVTNYL